MPFALDGENPPVPGENCPVDCAVTVLGSRASILLLRQAFYGDRRFEAFVAHTGISEATVAKRLQELVEAGALRKHPYREPGRRARHEYELTDAGEELLPVVLALFDWGRKHLPESEGGIDLVGPDERPVRVGILSSQGLELQAREIHLRAPDQVSQG